MMSFLSPIMWIAAAAVAIPIVLHLMRRRELREVTFPAIRYLRQAERRHAKRLRLRHLLLLATRLLIIISLAAAAAGPLVGRGGPDDHRPTAVAIVLDDSQSASQLSGQRRLLDAFAERIRLALDLTTPDDQLALFSATGRDASVVAQGPAAIRDYLRDLTPVAASADLPAAIRQADLWLSSVTADRERELHVLTDLQAVSVVGGELLGREARSPDHEPVVVAFSPDYTPQPNGAPGEPRPEVAPLNAGQPTLISVPLNWFGSDAPAEAAIVRLVVRGAVVAVADGRFDEFSSLRLPAQDSGWVQGYVEIDPSGLTADDRRYFSWLARPIATVTAMGDVGAYVELALETLEQGERLQRVASNDAEVWITAGGERLRQGLADGRSVLIIPPPSSLDLPRLNGRLENAGVPWRYLPPEDAGGTARLGDGAPLDGLAGLAVRRHYRITPAGLTGADSALIRLRGGDPWLVRGTTVEGTVYLLFASPLIPESSDLPVNAAMVPFLDSAIGNWARPGAIPTVRVDASSEVQLPPRARTAVLPDGTTVSVEGGAPFRPRLPGNYAIFEGERLAMAFSLNAPVTEGDLVRVEPEELEALLPEAEWTWSRGDAASDWGEAVFRSRRGAPAWRPLVALLLAIAILEAGLAAAGRRRVTQTGAV